MLSLSKKLGLSNTSSRITPVNLNFTFSVNTSTVGSTDAEQFQLPFVSTGFSTVDVDWGDGNTDTITSWNQSETLHNYSAEGIYTIKISNTVKGFRFGNAGDKDKINVISNWGELNINIDYAFMGCSNMTCTATDYPIISSTTPQGVFRGCTLFNGTVSNWDMSLTQSLYTMFKDCTSFDQPLDAWDISRVTNLKNFLDGGTLSTANYDALLISWAGQEPEVVPEASFGNSQYTLGGAADNARSSLVVTYGWTIIDGGGI